MTPYLPTKLSFFFAKFFGGSLIAESSEIFSMVYNQLEINKNNYSTRQIETVDVA